MAKKIIEKYVSDLSGEEMPEGSSPLRFAFDGKSYEIDLTAAERRELESALARYIAAARPTSSRRSGGRAARSAGGPDPKVVREWARANGHDVPARGRIPASILEAFAENR